VLQQPSRKPFDHFLIAQHPVFFQSLKIDEDLFAAHPFHS
jgi:hypothetical protein